jgi:hypothetical protein
MNAEDWESIEAIDANLTKIVTETLKTADDWVSEATARAIIDKVRAIAFRESASAAIRRYQTNGFRAEYWWDTSTNPKCETSDSLEGELHLNRSTMMTALARLSDTDVALVLTQMALKGHDGSSFQVATVEDVKEWRQSQKAASGPQFIVSLPDGYNGHTVGCLVEPIARDGSLVKLQVAGRGREHLIRWIDSADLQTAIAAQIATAQAWEYRDEKEGVQFLSLDRLPDDKRAQWTSERPLDSVPASLQGLDVVAQAPAKTSETMQLVSLASENPDKMRALAERLLVTKGSRLFGRIPARRDEAGALKAMGIKLGGYDSEAGCFHACVEPATLDREAVAARDLDLSELHAQNRARMNAEDYSATVEEIDAEIARCEYLLSAHSTDETARHVDAAIQDALRDLRWSRVETKAGPFPIPVTVVASQVSYPLECRAKGLLLSDRRVVVNYPFKWAAGTDPSFDPRAQIDVSQIDISHVVLENDGELPEGWRAVGTADLKRDDYHSLDESVQRLEKAFAMGQDQPHTVDLHERINQIMDKSPWMIDVDSGDVVPSVTEPLLQISAVSMRP